MDALSIVRIAVALVCSSVSLRATTITTTLGPLVNVMTISGTFTGTGGFANRTAGVLNFDYADAFCVEPLQLVSGTVVYDVQPTINLTNLDSIAKVMGAFRQSSKSNLEAAGAQWAIWEIVGDGINYTSNSFKAGNIQIFFDRRPAVDVINIETKALFYLGKSQDPGNPSASLLYATNTTTSSQDVVFMIPEPSSALLGALGLTSLLIRRRPLALDRVS